MNKSDSKIILDELTMFRDMLERLLADMNHRIAVDEAHLGKVGAALSQLSVVQDMLLRCK